ncbi:MAG: hypothetical protein ACK49D_09990 [Flavobacteriia bacterium]
MNIENVKRIEFPTTEYELRKKSIVLFKISSLSFSLPNVFCGWLTILRVSRVVVRLRPNVNITFPIYHHDSSRYNGNQ